MVISIGSSKESLLNKFQIVLAAPARRRIASEEQTVRDKLLLLDGQLIEQFNGGF